MPGFRRLSELDLDRLDDEALVAYVRDAREAGELETMQTAIRILAFGHRELVVGRVRMRMERAADAEVEEVVDAVLWGAMLAEFRGETIAEFRGLLSTIIQRRVADHYRSRADRRPDAPLPSEHGDDEEVWGVEPVAAEEISGVWARDLLDRELDDLSEAHRLVVERRLDGYSSRETAELVTGELPAGLEGPMTAQNVDQIYSRFRRRFHDLISEADRSGGPTHETTRDTDG